MIARTTFGRSLAVALSLAVSQLAVPAAQAAQAAGGHLAQPQQVSARLAERAAERAEQVRLVQDVLDSDVARQQAGLLGLDVGRLRGAVPHLSDGELEDLSQRAANVQDVAAGHRSGRGNGRAIAIVVGVVLLVVALAILVAAGGYDDGYYYDDDCYCY